MNSQIGFTQTNPPPKLSIKELEVLWLYDCKFSDQKILEMLYLKQNEFVDLKLRLFEIFNVSDTNSLINSAIKQGFVH